MSVDTNKKEAIRLRVIASFCFIPRYDTKGSGIIFLLLHDVVP